MALSTENFHAMHLRDGLIEARRLLDAAPFVLLFVLFATAVYRYGWQGHLIGANILPYFILCLIIGAVWTFLIARAKKRAQPTPFPLAGALFLWGSLFLFSQGPGGKALWMLLPISLATVALFDTANSEEGNLYRALKARAGSLLSITGIVIYCLLFGRVMEGSLYPFGFVIRVAAATVMAVVIFSSFLRNLDIVKTFALSMREDQNPQDTARVARSLQIVFEQREAAMCLYFSVCCAATYILSSVFLLSENPNPSLSQYNELWLPTVLSILISVIAVVAYFTGTLSTSFIKRFYFLVFIAAITAGWWITSELPLVGLFFCGLWAAPRWLLFPSLLASLVTVMGKTQMPYDLSLVMTVNFGSGLILSALILRTCATITRHTNALACAATEVAETPLTSTPGLRANISHMLRMDPRLDKSTPVFFIVSLCIFSFLGWILFRAFFNSSAALHVNAVNALSRQINEQIILEEAKIGLLEHRIGTGEFLENIPDETLLDAISSVEGEAAAYIVYREKILLNAVHNAKFSPPVLSDERLSTLSRTVVSQQDGGEFEELVDVDEATDSTVLLLSSMINNLSNVEANREELTVVGALPLLNPSTRIGSFLRAFGDQENGRFTLSLEPVFPVVNRNGSIETSVLIRSGNGELNDFSLYLKEATGPTLNFNTNEPLFLQDLKYRWIVPMTLLLSLLSSGIFDTLLKSIADRKDRENAIERANSEIAMSLERSRFFAKLSHEIRTPLNGIIGMTKLALQNPESDDVVRYLSSINASGEVLIQLINDILDFSKLEEGKFNFYHEAFSMQAVIETAIEIMTSQAQAKSIKINLATLSLKSPLRGDSNRVLQIVLNLLSNAVKFSYYDSVVTLSVEETSTQSEKADILISVRDTGIGISPEHAHTLFEPFSQVKSALGSKATGTGLGLSICKQLVEAMNGRIWLESTLGEGSTFHVHLRLDKDTNHKEISSHELEEEALFETAKQRLRGKTILIVDDNTINLEILRLMLTAEGIKTVLAHDGAEAVVTVREKLARESSRFDAILMDLQMPEMDGVEATCHILRLPTCDSIPIIALSANIVADEIVALTAQGFVDCLQKPASLKSLMITLNHHIA